MGGDGLNQIKNLRLARGWTQAQLGEKIRVGNTAVSQYESETRQLDPATIHLLCDLFGCTSDYLLGRSESPFNQLSEEDYKKISAYRAAIPEIQKAVDDLLAPYMPGAEKKKA